MKSFIIKDNTVILNVKKSPVLVRFFLYLVTFLSIFLPLLGLAFVFFFGGELKFGLFVFFGVFGLISFFMLRTSLWNTFGREILEFNNHELIYVADYGWFKDGQKTYKIINPEFKIKKVGFEEDNLGILIIKENDQILETVTKIHFEKLEDLISTMEKTILKVDNW